MSKDSILDQIRSLSSRFDDPNIRRTFKQYNKTVQFTFPDIDIRIFMRIGDAEILEIGTGEIDAELELIMDSSIFTAIIEKSENPLAAYSEGKLKTKGDIPDILKLQKLLV
jgi:putative sterol carrier protein